MLSANVRAEYQAARAAHNHETKVQHLIRAIELAINEEPLLDDAKRRFKDGTPDIHRAMTSAIGQTVFEIRDPKGAGWRGALIQPLGDEDFWLVYVDRHDHFHSSGPQTLKRRVTEESLGPTELDRKIRSRIIEQSRAREVKLAVLSATVEALRSSNKTSENTRILLSQNHFHPSVNVNLEVHPVVDDEVDVLHAHEEISIIRIEFLNASRDFKVHAELQQIILPFLQSDPTMIESLKSKHLIVQIALSQAQLIQLIANGSSSDVETSGTPPVPTMLHYTRTDKMVEAFVKGTVIRAVCGQWFIPVGDSSTHSDLPICPDCEDQQPFMQAQSGISH